MEWIILLAWIILYTKYMKLKMIYARTDIKDYECCQIYNKMVEDIVKVINNKEQYPDSLEIINTILTVSKDHILKKRLECN